MKTLRYHFLKDCESDSGFTENQAYIAAKMKEERVFGKNPEVYKILKQMYMIVFKEKQMDRLKGM